jgi:hypothetical protein
MNRLFDKSSLADRKLKRIEKQLATLDKEIHILSKFVEKPGKSTIARLKALETAAGTKISGSAANPASGQSRSQTAGRQIEKHPPRDTSKVYEDRFADYLASSFQTVQVLRHEKSIQRNKAIVMVVIVVLVLWALLYHLFA